MHGSERVATRWRAAIPAAILILIAAWQIAFARSRELSPWKGGGFGMFATLDGTASRYVRLVVEGPDRSEEVEVHPSFEKVSAQAQLFPSGRQLTRLASIVAAREARHARPVERVIVQIWRIRYAGAPLRATELLLQEMSVDVAELPAVVTQRR